MSMKTLMIAAATVAMTASAASADSFFSFGETLEDRATLELGVVKSEGAGTVEIFNFARGEQGALLGSADVHAGANTNVRVPVGTQYLNDVIAVLTVDGNVVATQEYDIDRD